MATDPRLTDSPALRQLAAAVVLLAGIVTFGVAFGVLGAIVGFFGLIGPVEMLLVALASAAVTWLVVRRLRAA